MATDNEDFSNNLNSYQQIQDHRKAIEAEFALNQSDPTAARLQTKDGVAQLGLDALQCLSELIKRGSSESVRLRASQFIIASVLDMDKTQDADDALTKLLTKLSA